MRVPAVVRRGMSQPKPAIRTVLTIPDPKLMKKLVPVVSSSQGAEMIPRIKTMMAMTQ